MDIQKNVEKNIKTIREQKKITLDSAAKLTGASRSMLAQIEKGGSKPYNLHPLENHKRI